MPTDTELVAFILASMKCCVTTKMIDQSLKDATFWSLYPLPGKSPREALEAAYAEYRTNLAQAEKSPQNSM